MSVALMPPVSSSCGDWHGEMPLTAARRYARGKANSRWHRPRSGVQWPDGRISLHYWCGQTVSDAPGRDSLWNVDEISDGAPACGTCVGRALGAKQDEIPVGLPPLRFDPRWITPPRTCPGSRSHTLWVEFGRVGRCLVCQEFVGIRAIGRGYNAWGAGPVFHEPGPGLVEPCPFHAWNRMKRYGDIASCACGWPYGGAR
jgi:hypothetical protein